MSLLALVHVDDVLAVDGQVLIRVNHHAEKAGVCLTGKKGASVSRNQKKINTNL